jgi:hypothetical protein
MFALLRQFALMWRIIHIADYIRLLEKTICTESPKGWETFLAEKRKSPFGMAISISAVIFWITLLVVTIVVGVNFGTSTCVGAARFPQPDAGRLSR